MQTTIPAPRVVTPTVAQYSLTAVLAVWAAATTPMAVLAWVVAPAVAGSAATDTRFAVTLIAALTIGLIWQFVLVLAMVAHEQHSLRWPAIRQALWLHAPCDQSGRRGGRLWLWLLYATLGVGVIQLLPIDLPAPASHGLGAFLKTSTGHALFHGNWALFALVVVMFVFNTVLGEELLFRGLLLPRMRAAFGKTDWIANGLLFGLYHLHQPWSIPSAITTGAWQAYTTRRYGSAWIGIAAHSAQSVLFTIIILTLVTS